MELNNSGLGALVRAKLYRLGWSQKELADKTELAESFINRIAWGVQPGSLRTVLKLAEALDEEPGHYFNVLAGYKEPEPRDLLDISELTPIQRKKLVNYLEILKTEQKHSASDIAVVDRSMAATRRRQKRQVDGNGAFNVLEDTG